MSMRDLRIYFYHGVVARKKDPYLERNFHLISEFRAQLAAMRRTRFLGVDALRHELERPTARTRDAAVITFDDGYANNLEAAEILGKLGIPWVLFATTGAIGRRNTIWTVELSLLLLHGSAESVSVLGRRWSLLSSDDRILAYELIRRRLKCLPASRCHAALAKIRDAFPKGETERLLNRFPSMRSLTWVELQQLSDAGVAIGSHGVRHDIHHANQPRSTRQFELIESAATLSKRLRKPCDTFAYPNGDHTDSSWKAVSAAGYRLAFTTSPGPVTSGAHPLALPRCEPPRVTV